MTTNSEELEEFKTEALELLDEAERCLLSLEKEGDFTKTYSAVFRVFHSLKGGAGMLGMQELQEHMHQLETHYQECKQLKSIPGPIASYFLSGIDVSRHIMSGKKVAFDYSLFKLDPTLISAGPSPTAAPTQPQPQKPVFNAEGIRVMAIDDEGEIVEVLKDLLTESGFVFAGYTSPKKAIEEIKTFKPDVILTDYKMPELTGIEVLKQVSKLDADLPVIYLSGHISKEVLMESLSHGIFDALEKPFRDAEVVAKCKNAAERYKMVRLLNSTISFIYFQYSDLDQYLQEKGEKEIREQMQNQFKSLLEAKRKLKFLKNKS